MELYGFNPELAVRRREARGALPEGEVLAAIDAAERLKQSHEKLMRRWREAGEAQAKYFNAKHTPMQYNVG